MEQGLVTDIAISIIAAWIVAVLSQVARQPLLLAYLVAGFAIGPLGFKFITDAKSIGTISEIGLSLLLFMIGLEIDLKKMLSSGKVITFTAAAQIVGCVLLGWLGFDWIGPAQNRLEALYLGVAAAMSSTVIIVKILYDKRELETLVGRITLGVLVLQDIATILFLAIQPTLKNPALGPLMHAFGNVILLLSVAFLASRYVLAAGVPGRRAPAGTGAVRRAGVVPGVGGIRRLAWPLHRHGRAHRRRDGLHFSLHAGCRRQGDEHPRFFCDAVFRGPRHENSHADVELPAMDDFLLSVSGRQPAGHGLSPALLHAPGLPRQPAARHQPLPDERAFHYPARARQQERRRFGQ